MLRNSKVYTYQLLSQLRALQALAQLEGQQIYKHDLRTNVIRLIYLPIVHHLV